MVHLPDRCGRLCSYGMIQDTLGVCAPLRELLGVPFQTRKQVYRVRFCGNCAFAEFVVNTRNNSMSLLLMRVLFPTVRARMVSRRETRLMTLAASHGV